MSVTMIGAGGHARAVAEALVATGSPIDAYVDPNRSDWLDVRHLKSDAEAEVLRPNGFVLGMGGVSPDELWSRRQIFNQYCARGWAPRTVIHPKAFVSSSATLAEGCVVLACAVLQPAVVLGDAVIVNTGAIVEHDSHIGSGTHVAPGAIVLGGSVVGKDCMIGAGAVVLPGARVPDNTFIPATARWPK